MKIDRRNDVDLRRIEAFAAVIERGTTPAAAEHLGLSQSAVWNAIRGFEQQLGLTLFERRGRKLEPTDSGRLVYDDLRPLLGVLDTLAGRLRSLKHHQRGRLVIAAAHSVGQVILPPAMQHVLTIHPDTEFDIALHPSDQVVKSVELGLADFGILMGPIHNPGVTTYLLGEAELTAVLARDHLLTTRVVLGPSELARDTLISAGPILSPLVEGAFALQGLRYRPQLRCDHPQTACAMVNAGLGVSVVDPYSARLAAGQAIVSRRFSPVTRIAVVAIVPPGGTPDPLVGEIIEALRATCMALAPAGWG
jgi:DNA-binding transcriptional LysR family regulator